MNKVNYLNQVFDQFTGKLNQFFSLKTKNSLSVFLRFLKRIQRENIKEFLKQSKLKQVIELLKDEKNKLAKGSSEEDQESNMLIESDKESIMQIGDVSLDKEFAEKHN